MQDLKKEDPNIIYVHNRVLFDTTDATTYVNDDAMGILVSRTVANHVC